MGGEGVRCGRREGRKVQGLLKTGREFVLVINKFSYFTSGTSRCRTLWMTLRTQRGRTSVALAKLFRSDAAP
eukprot:1579150-Rhodomonas_salina.2